MMKPCPYCTKDVSDDDVKCRHCGGWFTNDADVRQKKLDDDAKIEKILVNNKDKLTDQFSEQTTYFSVPQTKMIVLCLMSLWIYEFYWFIKNWKAIKIQEGKKLSPFWRSVFFRLLLLQLI